MHRNARCLATDVRAWFTNLYLSGCSFLLQFRTPAEGCNAQDLIGSGRFRGPVQPADYLCLPSKDLSCCIRQPVLEYNCVPGNQCRSVEVTPSLAEDALNASNVMSRSGLLLDTHSCDHAYRCLHPILRNNELVFSITNLYA
jgi:hypothetical protein